MRRITLGVLVLAGAAAPALAEVPVTLRGSPESMLRQNEVARERGLTFVENASDLSRLQLAGELVRLQGNPDYELADFVRYSQARPEMRLFIERLAAQYHAATGEKLVVTSLTRPASRQPGNAHELSVHPAGIAVDLRVSQRPQSREWLEGTLLSMEERGLLDVTRERNPPHYHIALFPEAYMDYAAPLVAQQEAQEAAREAESSPAREARSEPGRSGRATAGVLLVLATLAAALFLGHRLARRGDSSAGA